MSPAPFRDLVTLDRLVHEPARFAILAALTACQRAGFQSLQSMTGLAQGSLSGHLQKLEEGRLITIDKWFKGKRPQTRLEITPAGRAAFQDHWKRLENIVTEAKGWGAVSEIRLQDLSDTGRRGLASMSRPAADSLRDVRRDAEDQRVDAALERHGGNRRRAAEELGISVSTLKRKLRRRL